MKTIFKVGDRVYDFLHGWGEVKEIQEEGIHVVRVDFDNYSTNYTRDGKDYHKDIFPVLSFTEYDLVNGGFSQERPVNYEEYIGKWGKFWDNDLEGLQIGKLWKFDLNSKYPFGCRYGFFNNFELLTGEQIKVLNLE